MSLINDALRKARQAAAEHEDQRNTGRTSKAYPSRAPRRGVGMGTILLVAVVAAIAGAAVVWYAGDLTKNETAVVAQLSSPAPGTVQTPPPPASREMPPPPVLGGDRAEVTTTPESPPDPPVSHQEEREARAPEPIQLGPQPTQSAEADPSAVSESTTERVFVMDADLGYASLSLGYIVFRPVRPFAEINGVEVYEGSEVEGFIVEKIEVDRIVLKDDRGPLILRVP